jgi:hypothetical protein
MNPITERWVNTLRAELPDRTLIWNQTHLQHALHDCGRRCNLHRTHRPRRGSTPRKLPHQADRIERLAIRRHDRLSGMIHEYRHAA